MDDGDIMCHPILVPPYLQEFGVFSVNVGAERHPQKTEVIYHVNDLGAALLEFWGTLMETAQMGMERLHKNVLQWLNAGGVQFVEDLGLVKTLGGGHFSQQEAACGPECLFRLLVVRAEHPRGVCACWRE